MASELVSRYTAALIRRLTGGMSVADLRRRLRRKLGLREPLNRFNARNAEEGARVLGSLAEDWVRKQAGIVLVAGGASGFRDQVVEQLGGRGLRWRPVDASGLDTLDADALREVACIVLAAVDSNVQLDLARRLTHNPAAADMALEYVALPRAENAPLEEWDKYINGDFVSPQLSRHGGAFYRIYRKALERFALKTDIRDYLDLCQLLESNEQRGVAGNVAEFGSFKGHSGFLISNVLEFLGSSKKLFMFDMFENFPEENVGVDRFWSGTHLVDFESVRKKFHDRPNVQLVKGDFTRTLAETETGPLALAFIDCDSYRATKYLLEYLWNSRIGPGCIVAMEDYGHAALLGNRIAVHEFFDGRKDAYTYFSQFSGFFVAVKLAPGA